MSLRRFKMTPIARGSGKCASEAAVRVLRRTNNPAVGWGDSGLLHLIATEMGWPHDAWMTEARVLDAIDRTHEGVLVKGYFLGRRNRRVRVFHLPECKPTKALATIGATDARP